MNPNAARSGEGAVRLDFMEGPTDVRPFIAVDQAGVVTYSEPGLGECRGQLDEEEHAALLVELTETLDLDAIDSDAMWDEIEAEGARTGLSPRIDGAGITLITVTLPSSDDVAGRNVGIYCPACRLLATRYPAVESLQRVAAAQSLLENLRAVMLVGGFDEARRLAELANEHLASQVAGQMPFTARELAYVRALPDGALFITFDLEGPQARTLSGTLEPGRPVSWIE